MRKKKKSGIAVKTGIVLAHVQSFADEVLERAFGVMKKAGKKEKKKQDTDTVKGKIIYGVSETLGFLGEVGESFYKKYEEIKAEKKGRQGR